MAQLLQQLRQGVDYASHTETIYAEAESVVTDRQRERDRDDQ